MSGRSVIDRVRWVLIENRGMDAHILAEKVVTEIESTHSIIAPEIVTEDMLEACFSALPEHYDPPDPKRRAWHAFKAKRRFTAMCLAAKKIID
jgi:hypothetical protein